MSSYQQITPYNIIFEQTILHHKKSILPIFLEIFMRLGWEIIAIDPSNVIVKTSSKWSKKSDTYAASNVERGVQLIAFDNQSNKITLDNNNKNLKTIVNDYEYMIEHIRPDQFDRFEMEYATLLTISKDNDQSLAKWAAGKSPEQMSPSLIDKLLAKLSL